MANVMPIDDPTGFDAAVAALGRGEVVVVPTDTVYGLAAQADRDDSARLILAIKDRASDVPLAVLVADVPQAAVLLDDLPSWASELVGRWWPGPLTIVGRRRDGVEFDLGEPAHTIGVRCPDDPFLRQLAARVGPLATTSANRHGEATPTTAAGVVDQLGDRLVASTLVIDGGPCDRPPSTVLDVTGDAPVILRAGALDLSAELPAAP